MKTQMMAPTRELMLVPRQAARRLGISVSLLHKLCAAGTGPVRYRYGKKVVFRQADVDAFAERHRVAPVTSALSNDGGEA